MNRKIAVIVVMAILLFNCGFNSYAQPAVKLGDDLLISKYHELIDGKNIGLVTNQTGVNSQGKSIIHELAQYPSAHLKALFAPEHGIDGKAKAGEYVESYVHPDLQIPVYSLYQDTRMPTESMLKGLDMLVFDIQDIGARSYTYISTLQYCMTAAKKYGKQIVVLDRPNPLGGMIVDGPVLEDGYQSFVGVDRLPMAHGMTVGELAQYFNRKIGADLKVVPMEGYARTMVFQDTGLTWIPSSPHIPTLASVFGYMATGLGEGTGIFQADDFTWVGGKGIDADRFARLLNQAGLPGVRFVAEPRGAAGGVRLDITDPHTFNPARTGIYVLACAHSLHAFDVPKSNGKNISMFDKVMGTNKIGEYLEKGWAPQQIEAAYQEELKRFKEERKAYLLYGDQIVPPGQQTVPPVKVWLQGGIAQGGTYYVPVGSVLTELGYTVRWDQDARQVLAEKAGKHILIDTEATPMWVEVNGKYLMGNVVPIIKEDKTYIPVDFFQELEQAKWEVANGFIHILFSDKELVVSLATKAAQPAPPAPVPLPKPPVPVNPKPPVPVHPQPSAPGKKIAYLTFDDGPSSVTTEVLDILKQNQIKATFFVIGRNIKGHEAILKRTFAEGHLIGGHTYSHNYDSIYKSPTAFFNDLEAGLKAIQQVIGIKPTIFRFPGGSNNAVSKKAQDPKLYGKGKWIMNDLVKQARERGYRYFDWNVSVGDASSVRYTVDEAIALAKAGTGSKQEVVILCHDASGKENTAKALPAIIKYLKSKGYSFGVLDENAKPVSFLKM